MFSKITVTHKEQFGFGSKYLLLLCFLLEKQRNDQEDFKRAPVPPSKKLKYSSLKLIPVTMKKWFVSHEPMKFRSTAGALQQQIFRSLVDGCDVGRDFDEGSVFFLIDEIGLMYVNCLFGPDKG